MQNSYERIILFGILIFLTIGAFFMVNVQMPEWAWIASSINMILFCLPVFWASRRWIGIRDTIILFVLLGGFALAIETTALLTGFPYGHFTYSDLLGYRLFGVVPWTVVFAWTPLILAAYAIADQFVSSTIARILMIPVLLVLFDLVLDPGAVLIGFWRYESGGWFYGVPFSNFVGWLVSGTIGVCLLEMILRWIKPIMPTPIQLISSTFLTIFFWTAISLFAGMYISALIGVFVVFGLSAIYLKFHFSFDDMIVLVDETNKPIRTARKLETHNDKTPLHRAFSIFLFNRNGETLVQKRALGKKTWAGIWSNSCCGHQMLHESLEDAAKRRLRYELGLSNISLLLILKDFRYRAEKDGIVENEICPVFVGFIESEPNANPAEVAETKWVNWEDFLDEAKNQETELSPWSIEEAQLLQSNPDFQTYYMRQSDSGK